MGFVVKAFKSVVKVVGKVIGSVAKVIGGVFGFSIGGKVDKAKAVNNLNKSLEPEAYRKITFGKMAAPLDVRYWEVWGDKGSKFDEVIALATHRINSVKEIYFEDTLGFNAAGAAQGKYAGLVTRDIRLGTINQTGMSAGSGTQWTASGSTFDGCAYLKLAWLPDEKKLPDGIPNRYTVITEGALVYDPRRDSTQTGGSGPHRANDRTTWEYSPLDGNGVPIGRNNALQVLWYLLGWTIPTKDSGGNVTGEMLVAGRGVNPQDINISSFIAAANACEAAGYYTDLNLSTEDSHTSNEDKITCSGLIGRLIDPGGLWSYYANVDDTANIAVDLTDSDIIQGSNVTWNEYQGMSDQFNQVRGKFVNPSVNTLYQPFPYPMVRDATYESNLGIKRAKPLDFEQVLDSTLAQRLARLFLNEGQYQGEFQASFNYKAVRAQAWSVVRYTSERFGWTKLFRVWRQDISTDSGVSMLLKEIHASIWSAGTVTPPLAPGLGLKYYADQEIPMAGVTGFLVNFDSPDGTKGDGFGFTWTAPPITVRRTEVRYRLAGTTHWTTVAPVDRSVNSVVIGPVLSGALYEAQLRHVSINEVPGPWTNSGQFYTGAYGNVNYVAITAAGGTAIWGNITGSGKPENNADVTSTHIASGIAGQGSLATLNSLPWELVKNASLFPVLNDLNVVIHGNSITNPTASESELASAFGDPTISKTLFVECDIIPAFGDGWQFVALANDPAEARTTHQWRILRYQRSSGVWTINNSSGTVLYSGFVPGYLLGRIGIYCTGHKVYGIIDGYVVGAHVAAPPATIWPKVWAFSPNQTTTKITYGTLAAGAQIGNDLMLADGVTIVTEPVIITAQGVASAIAGQGALATLNGVTYGTNEVIGFGSLSGLSYVYLGDGKIRRSDGVTTLTEPLVVTSQGVASGIAGQGSLATANTVTWSNQVLGAGKPRDYAGEGYVSRTANAPMAFQFIGDTNGFYASNNCTVFAYEGETLAIAATGVDPHFSKNTVSFGSSGGAIYPKIRARIKATTPNLAWEGTIYYQNAIHGLSGSYYKNVPQPPGWAAGEWVVVEWDMHNLTAGGADWKNYGFDIVRFDLALNNGSTVLIDWIAFGDFVDASLINNIEDGADVTSGNIASGISGQSTWATDTTTAPAWLSNAVDSGGNVKTNKVGTGAIVAGSLAVPSVSTGSDTTIPAGTSVDIIETGWITIGDSADGQALILAFGEIDGGSSRDVGARLRLYVDIGAGWQLMGQSAAGARTTTSDADTLIKATVLASTVVGAQTCRILLNVVSIAMPGASAVASTVRNPQIVVLGAKR